MLYQLHTRLCEIFQKPTNVPFANISVIVVGDLLQIQPVKGKYVFAEPADKHFKPFHQSNPLWRIFEPFLLVHNHRQGEGGKWTEALNRFRFGTFTDDDLDIIRGRITEKEFLDQDAEHVMFLNEDVVIHNDKMLKSIKSP